MILLLATSFGLGRLPKAPGTWGALLGIPLAWVLAPLPVWQAVVVLIVLSVVGCIVSERARKQLGIDDPSCVSIDETIGCAIALCGHPLSWPVILLGFGLFRLFDIFKPWPVKWGESLPGGIGIMADDLIAGVLAWLGVYGYLWLS